MAEEDFLNVQMPDGQVISGVPRNITQTELQRLVDNSKLPTIPQTRTSSIQDTTKGSDPFTRLALQTQLDPFIRSRATELGLDEGDFTLGRNMQGFGELGLHLLSFMPAEAGNTIGGAIAIGMDALGEGGFKGPMDAFMVGRGMTEEALDEIKIPGPLESVGVYEPRTKEGKFFVEKFNSMIDFLGRGEELEQFALDQNLPNEVALGARIIGDAYILAAPFALNRKSKATKQVAREKAIADNIMKDAEIEASRLIRDFPVEGRGAAIDALAPSKAFKLPPTPGTSKLGTPSVGTSESIIGGTRMQSEFAGILTEGAKDVVANKPSGQRIFNEVADLIEDGYFGLEAIVESVKKKHSLTDKELGAIFRETGSESGRFLQKLSTMKRELTRLAKENPAMADLLGAFEKHKTPNTTGDSVFNFMRRAENTRRTGLTSQLITAVRNAEAGTMMSILNMFDRAVSVPLRGGKAAIKDRSFRPLVDELAGISAMMKATKRFTPKGREKLRQIMEEHPLQKSVLFSKRNPLTAEVYGDLFLPRTMQVLQTFNRTQEHFFLRSAMELSLRDKMARAGLDFDRISPKDVPQRMIDEAFQSATEVVFASRPKGQTVKRVVDAWNAIPVLSMAVTPFPRFMFANYIPFAGEFGPQSLVRLLSQKQRTRMLNDPVYMSRIVTRSIAGTAALSLFLHNAMWKDPAAKPTEIQIGDNFIDMNPLAPFTSPLMILAEAIVAPENIDNKDLLNAITGVNRTGATLFGTALNKDVDNLGELLMRMSGDYLGSFFVPLSQLKDVAGGFSPDEAVLRSAKGHPLLGPILKNVPGGSEFEFLNAMAPPTFNPLYPGFKRHTNPWRNQLTGTRPKLKGTLEREAERLDIEFRNFSPATGDRRIDNMVNYYWGHFNEQLMLPALENMEVFTKGSKAVKRKIFKEMLSATKQIAILRTAVNHPREGGKLLADKTITSEDDLAIMSEMLGKTPDELREQIEGVWTGVLGTQQEGVIGNTKDAQ